MRWLGAEGARSARDTVGAVLGLGMRREHRAVAFRSAASSGGGHPQVEVPMRRWMSYRLLPLVAVFALLACSDADAPSAPSSAPNVSFSLVSDSAKARHEALKEELEARKAYFKEMKEANRDALKEARAEWKEWRADWRAQYKLAKEAWKREHPGEKGGPEIQLLRCEPREYAGDAAVIGPKGGTLHMGDHELVIPEGALDEEVLVSAEAPTSSLVDVKFQPHGLQFRKPAQLTLSYERCVRPTSADLLIAYLGLGNQVWELPPSVDDKSGKDVTADIDHFSRYAVAW